MSRRKSQGKPASSRRLSREAPRESDARASSRLLAAAGLLLCYLAVGVAFTWPLAKAPASTIEWGWGDPLLVAYVVNWGAHALWSDPSNVFDAPFYYPTTNALSYSDHLLSVSWPLAPLVLFMPPLLFYNMTVFASFVLSALGFFLYLRRVGCGLAGAWLGGLLFGFMPWRYGQLGHTPLLYTWWIPIALLFAERWITERRTRAAAGLGAAFALVLLASIYHALFFAAFLGFYVLVRARTLLGPDRPEPLRLAKQTLLAAVVFLALALPSLLAYRAASEDVSREQFLEWTERRGAEPRDYLNPPPFSFLWKGWSRLTHPYSDVAWEMNAFPGALGSLALLLSPLLFVGRAAPRNGLTRGPALSLLAGAAALFVISLGPTLHAAGRSLGLPLPYRLLFDYVPGFNALRVPARASFYVGLAGAALLGLLYDRLDRRVRSRPLRYCAAFLAAAAALLDVAPGPLPYLPPVDYQRFHAAMTATDAVTPREGADLVLPLDNKLNFAGPFATAPRFRPILNGNSGHLPTRSAPIFDRLRGQPFGAPQAEVIRDFNVTRVLLDQTLLSPEDEQRLFGELFRAGCFPRSAGISDKVHVLVLGCHARGAAARPAPGS